MSSPLRLDELRASLGRVRDLGSLLQGLCARTGEVPTDLREARKLIEGIRSGARTLGKAVDALPPIPAGPIGPIITALKKILETALRTAEATAGALEPVVERCEGAVKQLGGALRSLCGATAKLEGLAAESEQALAKLSEGLKGLDQKRRSLEKLGTASREEEYELAVEFAAQAAGALLGDLQALENEVRSGWRQVQTTLTPILLRLRALDRQVEELSWIRSSLTTLAAWVLPVADWIRAAVDAMPGFVKKLLGLADRVVEWAFRAVGLEGLMRDLLALDRLTAPLKHQLQALETSLGEAARKPIEHLEGRASKLGFYARLVRDLLHSGRSMLFYRENAKTYPGAVVYDANQAARKVSDLAAQGVRVDLLQEPDQSRFALDKKGELVLHLPAGHRIRWVWDEERKHLEKHRRLRASMRQQFQTEEDFEAFVRAQHEDPVLIFQEEREVKTELLAERRAQGYSPEDAEQIVKTLLGYFEKAYPGRLRAAWPDPPPKAK